MIEKTRNIPHRLVVRKSRRGRDNPGSNPGVVIEFVHVLSTRVGVA